MARPIKVFPVEVEETPAEPIPFGIQFIKIKDGREVPGEPDAVYFKAYGEAPAGATLVLGEVIRWDVRGRRQVDLNGITHYFETVLPPADYERFRDLMSDPTRMVKMPTLSSIFEWLVEQYSSDDGDRPTTPSHSSSDGRRDGNGGPSSTPDTALAAASTSADSA